MLGVGGLGFSLTTLHSEAYELEVVFPPLMQEVGISSKTFTFIQKPAYVSGEMVDIYSLNGVCQRELFKCDDGQAIQKAADKWLDQESASPTIVVLDLKDSHLSYQQDLKIAKYENAVCDFFKSAKTNAIVKGKDAKKVYPLSEASVAVDFVLREGSLKHDLLSYFSPAQGEYLLSKQGGTGFCQCAEFFMNGFKLGQEAAGISAENYVTALANKKFHPYQTSIVWYPPLYKEMYSLQGPFAKALKSVFSVTGAFDEKTGITSLNVEMPE